MDRKALIFILLIFLNFCKEDKLKKAERFLKEGKIEEAEYLVLDYLKKNEKDSRALLLLADIYFTNGEYYKSLQILKKIPEKEIYKEKILEDAKYIFEKTKYSAKEIAVESAEIILLLSPDYYEKEFYSYLGKIYLEKGKTSEAEKIFKKIWEKEKDYDSFLNLLNLLYEKGEYLEIVNLEEGIPEKYLRDERINFIIGNSLFEISKIYYTEEKIDSALIFIDKFLEIKTPPLKVAEAYYIKGEILLSKGDTISAIENFYNVIKENPANETGLLKKVKERLKELKK
jgi:tetratricopeptide (TPR) repeat protein